MQFVHQNQGGGRELHLVILKLILREVGEESQHFEKRKRPLLCEMMEEIFIECEITN